MKIQYYSLFDNEEIAGKRYALGEPIDGDVHPAALDALASQGRLSTSPPVVAPVLPVETKVQDMSRPELEAAAIDAVTARVRNASDDDLRSTIERHRDETAGGSTDTSGTDDNGAGDGSTGGTSYADLKDKPLATMKTADLDTIAREEGVNFDGAKNNPDRVKLIEAKRNAAG